MCSVQPVCFLKLMLKVVLLQYKFLKKEKDTDVKIEGKNAEDWMCIDFGMSVYKILSADLYCS